MQIINGIQNAIINTNAAQNGMVVDAANAHRTDLRADYLRPVSKRSLPGEFRSTSKPETCGSQQLTQTEQAGGNDLQTICSGRTWRHDSRHLPGAAWAMLVLNRSMCG